MNFLSDNLTFSDMAGPVLFIVGMAALVLGIVFLVIRVTRPRRP